MPGPALTSSCRSPARRERRQRVGHHPIEVERALAPAEHEHGRAVAARARTHRTPPSRAGRGATARSRSRAGSGCRSARRAPTGSRAAVPSNVVATAAAQRAAIRLTTPGTLFGSIKTSGRACAARGERGGPARVPADADDDVGAGDQGAARRGTADRQRDGAHGRRGQPRLRGRHGTGTNRKPASGTSCASWPSSAPMNTIEAPCSRGAPWR